MSNIKLEILPEILPVTLQEGIELLKIESAMELAKIEAQELRLRFIALLPFATRQQMAIVTTAASSEDETPEGFRVNQDFKLSVDQVQELKDVRQARADFCSANKADIVGALMADASQKLKSVKVRIGSKKTVSTLRFERMSGQGKVSVGLLADLRARLGNQ